jgi:hypothetical protein
MVFLHFGWVNSRLKYTEVDVLYLGFGFGILLVA